MSNVNPPQQRSMDETVDVREAMRAAFESGNGILVIDAKMPDSAILAAVKLSLSYGKAFTVLPQK